MNWKNLLLLVALLALFTGTGGCIFSPDDDGGGEEQPPTDLPDPVTPDIMMSNFEAIYEGMMADEYEELLHAGYRTVLLEETIDEWAGGDNPLEDDYFNRDDEVQIHRKIFDNLSGQDPLGNIVEPIESIDVGILEKQVPWTQVESSLEYFGQNYPECYTARYNVLIHFYKPDGSRFEVDQVVDFMALNVDGLWYMLGQIGLPPEG